VRVKGVGGERRGIFLLVTLISASSKNVSPIPPPKKIVSKIGLFLSGKSLLLETQN